MRCDKWKRLISDGLDGALEPGSRARLEAHLEGCPSCREYSLAMARLQAASREIAPMAPAPERMARSMARLKAGLGRAAAAGLEPGLKPAHAPLAGPQWAWAGLSAGLLVVLAGLYFTVLRPGRAVDIVPYDFSNTHADLVLSLSGDDALASAFDSAIRSSLGENGAVPAASVEPLAPDAGIFLDSLTDEEVLLLEAALQELLAL